MLQSRVWLTGALIGAELPSITRAEQKPRRKDTARSAMGRGTNRNTMPVTRKDTGGQSLTFLIAL